MSKDDDKPPQKPTAKTVDIATWKATRGSKKSGLRGVLASSVPRRKVEWLWPGRIPLGKITMLDGQPGLGKSLLMADLAARVTTGQPFFGSVTHHPPSFVYLLTNEDELDDTIGPRLDAACANSDLLRHDPELSFPSGLPALADDAQHYRESDTPLRLVIIDPLPSFLDEGIDPNATASIKNALVPLAKIAAAHRFAVLIVRHFSKRGEGAAVTKGAGSISIVGQARAGMLIACDPDDPSARVLSWSKLNCGPLPSSLRYRVADDQEGRPVVQWIGASDHDAESLVAPRKYDKAIVVQRKVDKCLEWLLERFQRAPEKRVLASEVFLDGARAGYSQRTIERAKARLTIVTAKVRNPAGLICGASWTLEENVKL